MRTKQQYTDVFIKNVESTRIPTGTEMVFFWQNVRSDGGMRLTDQGFRCLKEDLDLQSYHIKLWDDNGTIDTNYKFLLDLDKHLEVPYYVQLGRWPRVMLFDEQTYFWATLHGDFQRFLDGYKV
tara:strand:- start:131 stop:502 length:372 start_codon:yes stop_codon:yes gene_type:complete